MEIKKEDLVRIRSFEDKFFYGIRDGFLDEVIDEVVEEAIEEVVELTEEELEAIAKEEKIAKLKAELEELNTPEV